MYLFDNICQICQKEVETEQEASRDHIIPVSRGGESVLENLQLAHRSCNTDKGSRLMEDIEDWYEDGDLVEAISSTW